MCRDVASGADRHLDMTFGLLVVESSSLVSVLFREAFNHPYISFFQLLVNSFFWYSFPYFFSKPLTFFKLVGGIGGQGGIKMA